MSIRSCHLYIRRSDYGLWDSFEARHPHKASETILKLVRLYMADKLYLEDGRQVKL